MKNKFAIIAALVLASTSVVTAYAVNSEKNDGSEPTNIKVTGSYIDSKSTTMSVDVEWEEMNFTYFGGHRYGILKHIAIPQSLHAGGMSLRR